MTKETALEGMKAYVWVQGVNNGGGGWEGMAETYARAFKLAGFETTYDISPLAITICNTVADPDVKCYVGIGHGSDHSALTGHGRVHANVFEDYIRRRGSPLSIGIAWHCGTPHAYTPSRWLNAMTLGHPDVVGERWDGVGWADPPSGSLIAKESWYSSSIIVQMIYGKTYFEASEAAYENMGTESGLNQGNKDLKLPNFYEGYPRGWFVDPVEFYADKDGLITRSAAVSMIKDYFKHQLPLSYAMKVINAYFR